MPSAVSRLGVLVAAVTVAASMLLSFGVPVAQGAEPATGDSQAGPQTPPLLEFPPAAEPAPPADVIVDTIDPIGSCTAWFQQVNYGGLWAAGGIWWEYVCQAEEPPCIGACNAEPRPYYEDHYYWDGSRPVYYGHFYGDFGAWGTNCTSWNDASTGASYFLDSWECPDPGPDNAQPRPYFDATCSGLDCSFDAAGSYASDGIAHFAWDFGDGLTASGTRVGHSYHAKGIYVATVTATDSRGAVASWSRLIAIDNLAPIANFSFSCSGLVCSFDGRTSSDPESTIANYAWTFGDGTAANGATVGHVFPAAGRYAVALTVRDEAGATGTATRDVWPMWLTARGYRERGVAHVDLSWAGPADALFDVYRDETKIATVGDLVYTDRLGKKASGTRSYRVCAPAASTCSPVVTVAL